MWVCVQHFSIMAERHTDELEQENEEQQHKKLEMK